MKVSKEQVADNRQHILDAAARLFRERGFEGVTVAQIMAAAGLTHGAFYGHFSSKDDLITQAFAHVLFPPSGKQAPDVPLKEYAAGYLSQARRDDWGDSCLFATLGTEAVRASDQTRATMTAAMEGQFEYFMRTAPGETPEEKRRAAIASWSALVGAMILARIATKPALSDEILAETAAWIGR